MRYSQIISYFNDLEVNRPRILDRTLHIWANQTIPRSEYELLVMEDGQSTEGPAIARAHKQEYPGLNIRYFTYDGRRDFKGPFHSWNVGVKQARADIVGVTMEDRLTSLDNIEACLAVHTKRQAVFTTVLPFLLLGTNIEATFANTPWRDNPKVLWANAAPSMLATGLKKEHESTMMSMRKADYLEIGGQDERWYDYSYWSLYFYECMLHHGLEPVVLPQVINVHHWHPSSNLGHRAHLYDGEQRRAQHEKIRKLNNYTFKANMGLEWGEMDGDEEIEL